MRDRRIATRQRSFLQGRITFNKGRSSIDCLVRDISETGAKLIFSDSVVIPDVVELYIPNKDETHRVRVQRRIGNEIGVAFEGGSEAATSPPLVPEIAAAADLPARLQKLESEFAKLQRKVNELQIALNKSQGAES
jgi:hypothetical protein